MRKVFRLICVALVSVTLIGTGALGKTADLALHRLKDPGDAPAINAADYAAYRHAGTASISGKIVLDESPYRDFHCDAPVLYPDTEFTRWLVEKWAFELDGKPLLKTNLVYPGDSGMHVAIPDYLDYMAFAKNSAVYEGRCQNFRDYTLISVEHLPAGKYILTDLIERTVAYTSHDTQDAIVYGPFGAAPGYVETPHHGIHPADGFVVATPYELVVEAGHNYTLSPDAVVPVAYFQDG
jgi:hypothetical protein